MILHERERERESREGKWSLIEDKLYIHTVQNILHQYKITSVLTGTVTVFFGAIYCDDQ